MKKEITRRALSLVLTIAVILSLAVTAPLTVAAADDAAPDGTHTIAEIFPDSVLAAWVVKHLNYSVEPDIDANYTPTAAELAGITGQLVLGSDNDNYYCHFPGGYTAENLQGIQYLDSIYEVIFSSNDIYSASLEDTADILSEMSALTAIFFSGEYNYGQQEDTYYLTGDISAFSGFSNLQALFLRGLGIEGDLSSLSGLTKLTYLDMSYSPQLTGELSDLSAMTKMQTLTLDGVNVYGKLSDLNNFPELTDVNLTFRGDITDDYSNRTITGDLIDLDESILTELRFIDLWGQNITGDLYNFYNKFENLRPYPGQLISIFTLTKVNGHAVALDGDPSIEKSHIESIIPKGLTDYGFAVDINICINPKDFPPEGSDVLVNVRGSVNASITNDGRDSAYPYHLKLSGYIDPQNLSESGDLPFNLGYRSSVEFDDFTSILNTIFFYDKSSNSFSFSKSNTYDFRCSDDGKCRCCDGTTYEIRYYVNFQDYDGTSIGDQQEVVRGERATEPDAPTRAGYTFNGWNKSFDNVTEDLTVTATYSQNADTPDTAISIPAITGVTAPVAGAAPVTAITETAQYTGTVAWSPALVGGTFDYNTAYTATITLTPKSGFTLTGVAANFFTVSGVTAANGASSGIITAVFPATEPKPDVVINIRAITGVTAPVANATPVTAITETAQYTGTVAWSPALVGGKFDYNTVYTATITLTPKSGFTLTGVAANFFTVAGTTATNGANSGVITAVFPATEPKPDVVINIRAITGITAPVAGVAPVTAITETAQYTGTVAWSPAVVGGKFDYNTTYTVTITLVPKSGFTLSGVAANFFTVSGATTETNGANSGTITAVFPATEPKPDVVVNIPAITGITAPVANATPVTAITETAQYTGTVAWSPALVGGKFDYNTVYTATITLTPKSGFTLTGVAANFFTVSGATATNTASRGVITAVFPATARKPSREIVKGTDTYQFINATSHFFNSSSGTYKITGDYYSYLLEAPGLSGGVLINGNNSTWKQYLIDTMNSNWGGSCFGMSAVLSLTKAGRLDPGFFQSSAQNLYQLAYPRNSETVTNLINYYQLMQSTPITNKTLKYSNSEPDNIRYLVDSMRDSAYPVIVSFLIYNDQSLTSLRGGHAVVGYELVENVNNYQIKIWDPNSLDAPSNTITISKDYSSASFSNTYPYTFIRSAHTVEENKYDYQNIQQLLSGGGYSLYASSGGVPFAAAALSSAQSSTALTVNYADFTITMSSGQSAVVENGVKTLGDLDIGSAEPLNEPDAELLLRFAAPDLPQGETYTITPSGGGAELRTVLFYDNESNGFYTRVSAAGVGSFVFGADGSVSARFAEPVHATVASTHNETEGALYTTMAVASGTEIGLAPAENGKTQIISDADTADITMSGDYNEVQFTEVEAAVVFVQETDAAVVELLNEDNEVLETKDVGCTITFFSLGGTPVEAITNIVKGATIPAPANPARDGYVFAGWYKDEMYAEKWSFSNPITETLTLYAKWDIDSGAPTPAPNPGGLPSTASPNTTPSTGDSVSVSYTQSGGVATVSLPDSKVNEIISKSNDVAVIDLSKATNATSASLPATALTKLANADLEIEIALPQGAITLDADAAASIAEQAGSGSVSVGLKTVSVSSLNAAQQAAIGDAVVYDISVTGGGKQITDFGGASAAIALPHTLKADQKPEGVVALYVDADGNTEALPTTYDASSKKVTFTTTHLSLYAIGYDESLAAAPWVNPFFDIKASDWFYSDVEYAYVNGLMTGVSSTEFAPNVKLTRSMLVTILYRYASVGDGVLDVPPSSSPAFSDVPSNQWYSDAIAWAASNDIVTGVGDNKFAPDEYITREQFATILYRFATSVGDDAHIVPPSGNSDIAAYTDVGDVSSWAVDAVKWAVSAGLINGVGDGKVAPLGEATRAEAAALFRRYNKAMK